MVCDMCGAEDSRFYAVVEGTELKVCNNCAGYGSIVGPIKTEPKRPAKQQLLRQPAETEIVEIIIPEYSKLIRDKREKLGLKQEEVAKKIAIKASLLQNMERGTYEPSLDIAKKLESFLKISIVETQELPVHLLSKGTEESSEGFTIGDMIKIKEKK